MSDLMLLEVEGAMELHQRMQLAAVEVEQDALALEGSLAEASALLRGSVPDVPEGARRVAGELRDSAADLDERIRMVLAGGPEMNEALGALERIMENFTAIESRGDPDHADGLLSRGDLLWAARSTDPATAEAAEWLLMNEHFFDQVETALHNDGYLDGAYSGEFTFDAEDRDGLMSLEDIDAFLSKTATWATLLPHLATIDTVNGGPADGFLSRRDFETFLADYNLTDDEAAAVRRVLDDRAFHSDSFNWSLTLDVISFVPVVGDVVDGARAIYYAVNGDYATASLYALGLVPLPGMTGSGVKGSVKLGKYVYKTATKSGTKAAVKEGARLAVKGTAANYAVYEGTRALAGDSNLRQTINYVIDDMLGPHAPDLLISDLDPQARSVIINRLEWELKQRLDGDAAEYLSEASRVIARRIGEGKALDGMLGRAGRGLGG